MTERVTSVVPYRRGRAWTMCRTLVLLVATVAHRCHSSAAPPAGGDTAAVPKTLGWFAGNINDGGRFLLSNVTSPDDNSTVRIADRMLRCCNDLAVNENGSVPMTETPPYLGENETYTQYTDAGIEVLVNLGGQADVVAPMYARKEQFAQEMLALALRWNFSGYTMDWEFGQSMNWTQWNETMALTASLLHSHGKKLGVCIQSGCGDGIPGWAGATNPPCATLFRDMPWADILSDMGKPSPITIYMKYRSDPNCPRLWSLWS